MLRAITIILSVAGLCVGIWAVSTADEKKPELPLARPASVNPFEHGIAALGVVEPSGKSVSIIAPEPGMVMEVFADVNDHVKVGQPLFRLDSRRIEADLVRAQAAIIGGQAEVARWHALPRAEDLPPLQAAVAAAAALVRDREEELRLISNASARGSGTDRDVSRATFALEAAKADKARAEAELAKEMAGGWNPDLIFLQARLDTLRADAAAFALLKDRLVVRAPRDGTILRRQIEAGEYALTDANRPQMTIGNLDSLNIRAQVDEEDIGLLTKPLAGRTGTSAGEPTMIAQARTRGVNPLNLTLRFIRIEPFARPKVDIAGNNAERVDTRVIDVLFEVTDDATGRIFPGQSVDVFIDTKPAGDAKPLPDTKG